MIKLLESNVRPIYAEVIKEEGYFPSIRIREGTQDGPGNCPVLVELWVPDLQAMLSELTIAE